MSASYARYVNVARTLIWRVLVLLTVFSAVKLVYSSFSHGRSYDYNQSRRKLESIALSLKIYRQFHIPKPVKERRSMADAGLPNGILDLAQPNKPWSLPEGIDAFRISNPRKGLGKAVHFTVMYYRDHAAVGLQSMSKYYAIRGERLPILIDFNMNTIEELAKPTGLIKAMILRLDGSVEQTELNIGYRNSIWEQ